MKAIARKSHPTPPPAEPHPIPVPMFGRAFAVLMGHEGGWANDHADAGGETKFGISQRAYPNLDIATLSISEAHDIYERDYWHPIKGDELPYPVALALFDAAVNSGVGTSICWMQASLGVTVDGVIGPQTMKAVGRAKPLVLAVEMLSRRMFAMHGMASWPAHGLGWTRRIIRLASQVGA